MTVAERLEEKMKLDALKLESSKVEIPKEKLTSKEMDIKNSIKYIEDALIKIDSSHRAYRHATDEDERLSLKEDAYLNYLIAMIESKLLGEKTYHKEGLVKLMGLTYDKLTIVEFEDYKIG